MRVHFPDNVDPGVLAPLLNGLDLKRTLFNCVSKSGDTIETIAQLLIVRERLKSALGEYWSQHLVVTTDPTEGFLRELADRDGLIRFEIPKDVGGRFSVFTTVGLLPAALAGVNLDELRSGIADAVVHLSSPDPSQNAALQVASQLHHLDTQQGRNLLFVAPYANALAPLGEWFQQLWAESLGKAGHGATPVPVVGATCQHSQLQLWMEGPQNAVVAFVGVDEFDQDLTINAGELAGHPAVDLLHGHTLGHLLRTEQQATEQALSQAGRPSFSWRMERICPQSLAYLMTHMMAATAYAGGLYGLNPFDQPGVEAGKAITRELLR
jgi:glucose-6-phosphate isomerase